jgi:hypothetical protein
MTPKEREQTAERRSQASKPMMVSQCKSKEKKTKPHMNEYMNALRQVVPINTATKAVTAGKADHPQDKGAKAVHNRAPLTGATNHRQWLTILTASQLVDRMVSHL